MNANQLAIEPVDRAYEPTAEEAAAFADEFEVFMLQLETLDRKVLELRLQDLSSNEIADEIQRSTRTVRRVLERVELLLNERLQRSNVSTAE